MQSVAAVRCPRTYIFTGMVCLAFVSVVAYGMSKGEFEDRYQAIRELPLSKQFSPFEELLAEKLNGAQRSRCLEPAAVAACMAKEYEVAVTLIDEAMAKVRKGDGLTRTRLLKARVWALKGLRRSDEALASCDEALRLADSQSDEELSASFRSQLLVQKAELLGTAGSKEEAKALYRRSISVFASSKACKALFGMALADGDVEAAMETWVLWCTAADAKTKDVAGASKRLLEALSRPGGPADVQTFRRAQYGALPALAGRPEQLAQVQRVLAEILAARGESDAALYEARVLFEACGSEALPDAVNLVTRILRELDGNVARANRVLRFANSGVPGPDGEVGTDDDLTDPLADVTAADSEERDTAFREGIASLPSTWEGRLGRAVLFRYWGKPELALRELKVAFKLAPMEQEPMQAVMDATASALAQASHDPGMADRYMAFQTFGAAGEDGKEGTDDDLANPLESFR